MPSAELEVGIARYTPPLPLLTLALAVWSCNNTVTSWGIICELVDLGQWAHTPYVSCPSIPYWIVGTPWNGNTNYRVPSLVTTGNIARVSRPYRCVRCA